jgi:CRISPR-associated endonuclease/helicase Cas3
METNTQPIAHAVMNADGTWRLHPLDEHLRAVSALAGCHAEPFGGTCWAALAGLWHDIGKYRPPFQRYIRTATGLNAQDAHCEGKPSRVPHSTAGAMLAQQRLGLAGRVLAYLIAGHHAGLYDWHGGLEVRLDGEDAQTELDQSLAEGPPADILGPTESVANLRDIPGGKDGFALWVRRRL